MSSNSPASGHPVPKPVSAYVGLLLAAVEDTKEPGASLVARIARLPIATFGQLLTARRRYDELAETGDFVIDAVVGMVRHRLGGSDESDESDEYDSSGDWMGDDFASPEAAGAAITSITGRSANGAAHDPWAELPDDADLPDDGEGEPTPLQKLEQFSVPPEVGAQAGGLKAAADLPLTDFDHMTGPQLRGRLRTLDQVQLVQLLDYERAHANRVPIVLMLENRLTKLMAAGD
ncbi:MAG TPA: hypothetical protein VHZ96_18540 [Frankiaceae bacterium]|nr:hypothetical protein [Frankiaceae bacterium]